MPIEKIHIAQFISLAGSHPILDVRSPGEYEHAHIPGAHPLPLFSDEERKIVGTTYKQQSREAAIKIGLDFFGPKMRGMVEQVEQIIESRNGNGHSKSVLVHCWRGGMRSAAVAWLLDLYGFKVYALAGGYKFFRRWALEQFQRSWTLKILGGYTGSGKTELLRQINLNGQKVIDLEALANHKGSAFGNIGMPPQPSQEMFENALALQLYLSKCAPNVNHGAQTDNEKTQDYIWLEDESQRIGSVNIPIAFWQQMRTADVYFIDIPFSERLKHIAEEYGQFDTEKMIGAIERIQKRLGGLETKTSVQFLMEGKIEEAFRILLKYYDKCYLKGLNNRKEFQATTTAVKLATVDAISNAKLFLREVNHVRTKKNLMNESGYR